MVKAILDKAVGIRMCGSSSDISALLLTPVTVCVELLGNCTASVVDACGQSTCQLVVTVLLSINF